MPFIKPLICALGVATAVLPFGECRAQGIPVYDAANMSQNILAAVRTLQSNVNEATQIANQMASLAHEARNLQQLPAAVADGLLAAYVGQYGQLVGNFNSINGLARDIGGLTSNYQALYPDRNLAGPLSAGSVSAQVQAWLDLSRRTLRGVYLQSGQVMAALPQASSHVTTILRQSQASNGALDAMQAQTQMSGQVASQLIQLNAQMATMYQAQTDLMAQQAQMQDVARRRAADALTGLTTPSTQPPAPFLPILH